MATTPNTTVSTTSTAPVLNCEDTDYSKLKLFYCRSVKNMLMIYHVKSCSAMEDLVGMKNYMKAWPTGSEILVGSSSLSYVMAGSVRDSIFVDVVQLFF